jgi:alanyl-tRNA synthetase
MRLAEHEAAALAAGAVAAGRRHIVVERVSGFDADGLKALAAAIVERPGHVVVLAGGESSALVVVARSRDVDVHSGEVVRHLVSRFGGRGGGRPELAQAGGLTAAAEDILEEARRLLGDRP